MRYLNCWDNKNFWGARTGPLTHASAVKLEIEKFSKMEKLGENISKLLNFVLILIFHGKKLKWAYENIWCLWWFLLSFLSLLLQQKSVHCRVVATKFYKTKIPSLLMIMIKIGQWGPGPLYIKSWFYFKSLGMTQPYISNLSEFHRWTT